MSIAGLSIIPLDAIKAEILMLEATSTQRHIHNNILKKIIGVGKYNINHNNSWK